MYVANNDSKHYTYLYTHMEKEDFKLAIYTDE